MKEQGSRTIIYLYQRVEEIGKGDTEIQDAAEDEN